MREILDIPPPVEYLTFSPSELFRYFFQIGRWTEDSFSADFQNYTRGKLISTVTVNKWKNRDVIPTRYSGPLFKMIEDQFAPYIAKDWIIAFETVWATHIARRGKKAETSTSVNFSDLIRRQHCGWIKSRYEENISGEHFSASDIYIPLQLIDRRGETETPCDIEDLVAKFTSVNETSEKLDWVFISGGPGSGKSMAAIHLAHEISKQHFFPIYLRGSHLSQIPIDIQTSNQPVIDSFSFKSFLKHFRASSLKTACLILDGIDEISSAMTGGVSALNQILSDLSLEQNVCRAHGKQLHVIAFGRHSHIDFATSKIPSETSKTFDMLGLDGRDQHKSEDKLLGRDLRAQWWEKYLGATGIKADPSLPDFLCTDFDAYSDFGSEPLLTYLICQIALGSRQNKVRDDLPHEAVNRLTYAKNRNEIYQDIVKHIHSRTPLQSGQRLEFRHYLSVLQHIALANWHNGDGRTVSIKKIQDSIYDKDTERAFQVLSLSSPDMLIAAFYYRMSRGAVTTDQARVEFTHKTFSEYLVSTLIFERFAELIAALASKKDLDTALQNWARLASAGGHEPNLADFCQKEAAIRYENFSHLNWDSALTLIGKYLNNAPLKLTGSEAITAAQRSASLLLFIWSCLNLERQKRTSVHFNLFETPEQFSTSMLKQIQLPNGLNLKTNTLTEPRLQRRTFLTPSLSALHLDSADLSQMSFSLGHIQSLNCMKVSFAMTHWSHVKVSASVFHKSVFQQAILHGNQWKGTNFSNCLFQAVNIQLTNFIDCNLTNIIFSQCHFSDVEFISVEMEGVIFDRCTFANCRFDKLAPNRQIHAATFRYCSFLDMEKSLERITHHKFESCLFQSSDQQNEGSMKNITLETQIGELLL